MWDVVIGQAKDWYQKSRQASSLTMALLPLRLYLGIFYILTGTNKIGRGGWGADYEPSLVEHVTGALERVPAFYAVFLENVVLNAPTLFTFLVAWGETFLGIAMLLGIFVRLGGFMGSFMAMNFSLSSGREIWLPSFDTTLSLALLILGLAGAGRAFGVDQFLSRRKQKSWIW